MGDVGFVQSTITSSGGDLPPSTVDIISSDGSVSITQSQGLFDLGVDICSYLSSLTDNGLMIGG